MNFQFPQFKATIITNKKPKAIRNCNRKIHKYISNEILIFFLFFLISIEHDDSHDDILRAEEGKQTYIGSGKGYIKFLVSI